MNKKEFIEKNLVLKNLPPRGYESPFIVALCGYSGSGKSHVSRILSKELGLYIVGGDTVRQQIYQDPELKNLPLDEIQDLTNEISNQKIKKILNQKMSIVIDRSVSALKYLNRLKEYQVPIYLIHLISDHEQNIERVMNRYQEPQKDLDGYGDIDSKSGVHTREMYEEIKERKVYDIPKELFDYQIDARKPLEEVMIQTKEIASNIASKYTTKTKKI